MFFGFNVNGGNTKIDLVIYLNPILGNLVDAKRNYYFLLTHLSEHSLILTLLYLILVCVLKQESRSVQLVVCTLVEINV